MSKKKEKPCFMEDIYLKHERLMYYIAGKYSEVSAQREDIVQTAVLSLLKNEATASAVTTLCTNKLYCSSGSQYRDQHNKTRSKGNRSLHPVG